MSAVIWKRGWLPDNASELPDAESPGSFLPPLTGEWEMKTKPVALRMITTIMLLLIVGPAFGQSISSAGASRRGAASSAQEPAAPPPETPAPAANSAAGVAAEASVLNTPVGTPSATPSLEEALKMDDSAVIVVGGADVRVGDLRSSIWAELERASGNPPPTKALRAKPASDIPDTSIGTSAATVNSKNAMLRGEEACAEGIPWVARIEGTVTSGSRFTIKGACFGDRPGKVELIGNLPPEAQRAAFEEWTKSKIVAVMPRVSGADDGTVAVTVVAAGGQRSAAKQAKFFAERETVQIPADRWRPSNVLQTPLTWTSASSNGDDNVSKSKIASKGRSIFQITVHPSCWLDGVGAEPHSGVAESIRWVEETQAPPNTGSVELQWRDSCVKRTWEKSGTLTYEYSITYVCGSNIELNASALCPIGVLP